MPKKKYIGEYKSAPGKTLGESAYEPSYRSLSGGESQDGFAVTLLHSPLHIFKYTFLNLLIFLTIICAVGGVLHADERPLRNVPTDVPVVPLNASAHGSSSLFTVHYSLLTEQALSQPLTQRYIRQYTNRHGVEYLNAALERGKIYLPFIIEEIEKRNMPRELMYLPLIESSYTITAKSRSGAVGLWQFMMNSIGGFDMKVNDMVDERRDFIKSTRGALQKLEDNYKVLGSWELALAAYNVGLGATTRIVKKTGVNDYWELCRKKEFRQETEHYVPKLIAAGYVLSQPRRFGINVWQQPFEWTEIPLLRQVSLDVIAEEANIDKELLKRLNAQFLHGITPANPGQRLIVPASSAEQVTGLLMRDDLPLIRYHYHVVKKGDTLWSMSRHYGTTVAAIEQHNPGISNRYLKLGETVVIPAHGTAPIPASRQTTAAAFNGSHVVQKGDTLWSISRRYGVDTQALAEANGMQIDGILSEGRTLKVPIIE